jgi:hypothetical protein
MEPHELDKYIGDKLKEADNSLPYDDRVGMKRVWQTVEPNLRSHKPYNWMKLAALILLLLLPSFYLLHKNMSQNLEIAVLSSRLTMMDATYKQQLSALSLQHPESKIIQHDTVRIIQTVERRITGKPMEIVRYVTDTVVKYQLAEPDGNKVASEQPDFPADNLKSGGQEKTVKTEYILAQGASIHPKKEKHRSLKISLGAKNNLTGTEPNLAFKAKL